MLPSKWLQRIDTDRDLAWNIESCFKLAKKNKDKISGTLERIRFLEKEIVELASGVKKKNKPVISQSLLKAADAKGENCCFT